ncbi:hypothetical protein SAMN04487950_1309 [Halogranum rubrum]|uniref:Uncharacterized protein n=1 Tax=Halogranum rubrum TaxID=553466 RepID=A0A1I4CS74_9EURY|nr:hypothetical protein [Halogranum rubrum]SFK82906.1 hypothetical protein SAMN04487950_1309 [Halogranum rubrum]
MVGPSLSDEEHRIASLQFKLGFVLVVGISAGIIALQAQGSLVQIGVAAVAGIVLGWLLLAYLTHIVPSSGR